jgi:hypothetical protein
VRLLEQGRETAVLPNVKTIKAINPGDQATVVFDPAEPEFTRPETIKVEVVPVHCETKQDNNSATYQVEYVVG